MDEKDIQNSNWDEMGKSVDRLVDEAVESQDFKDLSASISEVVNEVISRVMDSGSEAVKSFSAGLKTDSTRQSQVSDYQTRVPNASGVLLPNRYFASVNGARIKGYLKTALGTVFSLNSFGSLLSMLLWPGSFWGRISGSRILTSLFFAAIGVYLLYRGVKEVGMCTRFAAYRRSIRDKAYTEIRTLAEKVGKSASFVLQDVKEMIGLGWFKEGHLDEEGTTLMVTEEMYRQYQENLGKIRAQMAAAREKSLMEKEKTGSSAGNARASLTREAREVLDKGNEYLSRIHELGAGISGEDISEKISRMELLIRRILERVQSKPEVSKDLRKMMQYYLPTTIKLLEAYQELERQPVQGENIQSAKREIVMTLDTLNLAFEKLLDMIFQDTAWDISTDISVLQTMLAQEGLSGDDFGKEVAAGTVGSAGGASQASAVSGGYSSWGYGSAAAAAQVTEESKTTG